MSRPEGQMSYAQILEDCGKRGIQRCHLCPRYICSDNTNIGPTGWMWFRQCIYDLWSELDAMRRLVRAMRAGDKVEETLTWEQLTFIEQSRQERSKVLGNEELDVINELRSPSQYVYGAKQTCESTGQPSTEGLKIKRLMSR